jgi:hypothetical protein
VAAPLLSFLIMLMTLILDFDPGKGAPFGKMDWMNERSNDVYDLMNIKAFGQPMQGTNNSVRRAYIRELL